MHLFGFGLSIASGIRRLPKPDGAHASLIARLSLWIDCFLFSDNTVKAKQQQRQKGLLAKYVISAASPPFYSGRQFTVCTWYSSHPNRPFDDDELVC